VFVIAMGEAGHYGLPRRHLSRAMRSERPNRYHRSGRRLDGRNGALGRARRIEASGLQGHHAITILSRGGARHAGTDGLENSM
jgi:hypothetical protein